MKSGCELITAERERQINGEGFNWAHDDLHVGAELASAAACYAIPLPQRDVSLPSTKGSTLLQYLWPWESKWWKPSPEDRVRELVKSGALIAAEIDRIQRWQHFTRQRMLER